MKTGINNATHIEKGNLLLRLLQSGDMTVRILPNHGMDFTPELRQNDLDRYRNFLMSSSYDSIMKQHGDSYVGD